MHPPEQAVHPLLQKSIKTVKQIQKAGTQKGARFLVWTTVVKDLLTRSAEIHLADVRFRCYNL